jgi:hypothetical protein
MAKNKEPRIKKDPYSEEEILKNRTFPKKNTVLLCVCAVIQIVLILFAIWYQPKPQDIIEEYRVTVTPLNDGSLDIEYYLRWTPLDENEPLTWLEIGTANEQFAIDRSYNSPSIQTITKQNEDGYTGVRIDLDRAYRAGATLEISFKINQRRILCRDETGYFHEFVPGWFNATPVEHYEFRWKNGGPEGDHFWSGDLDCGEYVLMNVRYTDPHEFDGVTTVDYVPFDNSGAYDEIQGSKAGAIAMAIILIVVIFIAEVYIVDSYVSYHRGRGFLSGYGHRVHVYGRVNPRYRRARAQHQATSSHSGGRGCACACACACAGGGRAGCSQKDTYALVKDHQRGKDRA